MDNGQLMLFFASYSEFVKLSRRPPPVAETGSMRREEIRRNASRAGERSDYISDRKGRRFESRHKLQRQIAADSPPFGKKLKADFCFEEGCSLARLQIIPNFAMLPCPTANFLHIICTSCIITSPFFCSK